MWQDKYSICLSLYVEFSVGSSVGCKQEEEG